MGFFGTVLIKWGEGTISTLERKYGANFAREKKKVPVKKIKFLPVKMNLLPVKKPKKVPVKKNNGREKVEKWAKKWA